MLVTHNNTILKIASLATLHGHTIVTAESCTAGLLATMLTNNAGASKWFYGSVVAYHNVMKTTLLSVPSSTLNNDGAVSENTAIAMCQGALQLAPCINTTIAITGIAGPDGGTAHKPVGNVCFAIAIDDDIQSMTQFFTGDRATIRQAAADYAILQLYDRLRKQHA